MKCQAGCSCGRHRKRQVSDETRRKIAESNLARWSDPDYRSKMSEVFSERQTKLWQNPDYREGKSCRNGVPVAPEGTAFDTNGYRSVKAAEHPLADSYGWVPEHRKVLYDAIGPGPHECHWNAQSDCGNKALEWGGRLGLCADHIDGERSNNSPDNLVPSCNSCNLHRHSGSNASRWAIA